MSLEAAATPGSVGRRVDAGQADDRRVIRLVRARRLLYARNDLPVASYYAHVKALWEEVAAEMRWSVAEVRRKWSHIRNSYSRHLRNELAGARTGRGRAVSRWYLADELEFLREHMATDTRVSPHSPYAPTFLELEMGDAATPVPSSWVDPRPWASPGVWSTPGALKPEPGALKFEPGALKPEPGALKSEPGVWASPTLSQPPSPEPCGAESCASGASSSAGAEECSYWQFFRGVHGEYMQLAPHRRRQFQRQCLAALHALLDEQDATPEPEPEHELEPEHEPRPLCVVADVGHYAILPDA